MTPEHERTSASVAPPAPPCADCARLVWRRTGRPDVCPREVLVCRLNLDREQAEDSGTCDAFRARQARRRDGGTP